MIKINYKKAIALILALPFVLSISCKKNDAGKKITVPFKGAIVSKTECGETEHNVFLLQIDEPNNLGVNIIYDNIEYRNVVKACSNKLLNTGTYIVGDAQINKTQGTSCPISGLEQYSIPEIVINSINEEYENPLTNTQWKLEKFIDLENNINKAPEPDNDFSYILKFQEYLKLEGFSSTNRLGGTYIINSKERLISIYAGECTFVNEYPDGDLFLESLKLVNSYTIKDNVLILYYSKDKSKYLQFKDY